MSLTVLNVAYPLAPVSPDAVGGAEQVVRLLDRGLTDAGHRSIVMACEGSRVTGTLVATPAPPDTFDVRAHRIATVRYRRILETVLARTAIDLVHVHGHDFDMYLPPDGVPLLATLHLPPELLIAHLPAIRRPWTWAHGVSRAQHSQLPPVPFLLPPIENGVDAEDAAPPLRRRSFALVLARICPEKGVHIALDAARLAGAPVLVGGMLFPYGDHQRYFEREVRPRLGRHGRFLGPVSKRRKERLLRAARCLLVPSTAPETSSLVAMEAMACGTPVIAFATGALPDVVEHGVTGFIVRSIEEMATAIRRAHEIHPETCRHAARARFSASTMIARYLERYETILSWCRTSTPAWACESRA